MFLSILMIDNIQKAEVNHMAFGMKNQAADLGKDPIWKLLLKLGFPAILAQIVNMLYNIVDRIYIGHIKETGAIALTGVGLCLPMILLVMAFSALTGMGGAPKAAIYMGKGDLESARKTLGSCVVMLTATAAVLTFVFLVFGKDLLYVFGASSNTISYAWSYLRIYVCGSIFVMISLGLNSFITTQGFSLVAMATILIGAAINIILDPVFKGARIRTVFGGTVLDLRKTKLDSAKTYIDIDCKFAGVEIYLPGDWAVNFHGSPCEDKRFNASMEMDKEHILVVRGIVMFGGIEFKS